MGYCQAKKVVDFQCYCRLFERVFDRTSKTIAAQTKLFGEKKEDNPCWAKPKINHIQIQRTDFNFFNPFPLGVPLLV